MALVSSDIIYKKKRLYVLSELEKMKLSETESNFGNKLTNQNNFQLKIK